MRAKTGCQGSQYTHDRHSFILLPSIRPSIPFEEALSLSRARAHPIWSEAARTRQGGEEDGRDGSVVIY